MRLFHCCLSWWFWYFLGCDTAPVRSCPLLLFPLFGQIHVGPVYPSQALSKCRLTVRMILLCNRSLTYEKLKINKSAHRKDTEFLAEQTVSFTGIWKFLNSWKHSTSEVRMVEVRLQNAEEKTFISLQEAMKSATWALSLQIKIEYFQNYKQAQPSRKRIWQRQRLKAQFYTLGTHKCVTEFLFSSVRFLQYRLIVFHLFPTLVSVVDKHHWLCFHHK